MKRVTAKGLRVGGLYYYPNPSINNRGGALFYMTKEGVLVVLMSNCPQDVGLTSMKLDLIMKGEPIFKIGDMSHILQNSFDAIVQKAKRLLEE